MVYRVTEVAEAVAERRLLSQWKAARALINQERQAIEGFVEQGGSAYGFTTMFGHLDSMANPDNATLFRGHTIGYPETVPHDAVRGIVAVKLCQLSLGGTGVTPRAYDALLDSFESPLDEVEIDLRASYGSGDVVPGAWLARAVLGNDPDLPDGDLMALINGAYVASGVTLALRTSLHESYGNAVVTVEKAAEIAHRLRQSATVQLPVSLRDTNPLAGIIRTGQDTLDKALQSALNRRSSNPLFDIAKERPKEPVEPVSNSSFLDFELSLGLQSQLEIVRVVSAYLCSAIRWLDHVAESILPDDEKPLTVQYPKVAKAYNDRLAAFAGTVTYAQAESRDVEDISDGALIRVLQLEESLVIIRQQTVMLQHLCNILLAQCDRAGL